MLRGGCRGPAPWAGRRRAATARPAAARGRDGGMVGESTRLWLSGFLAVRPPVADARCSSRCPRPRLARQRAVCSRAAGGAAATSRAFGVASRQAPPAPAPAAVTGVAPVLLERRASADGERAGHPAAAICLSPVHPG